MENEFLNSKNKRHTQVCKLLHTKLVSEEKKVITSHKRMATHTKRVERHAGRSDVSSCLSSEEDNGHDWKDHASLLEKENLRLKNKILELEDKVETLILEQESIRKDVIRQSQLNYNCDADLYKRINDLTRKTLFHHVKFITSEKMLNDLESKTSLGNITMNHFKVDDRDRISWWRACSGAVTDAMCNHRSTIAQAIIFLINSNSPFYWNN
jgi:predicted RNase H-like nuclease (RuvC/YqgF family)